MRSGALLHVDDDVMRSVAIGCEFGLNVCPDRDKGNYDFATIGLDRHIQSQFDYRHLPPELFQGKNTIHDHERLQDLRLVVGWNDRPIR